MRQKNKTKQNSLASLYFDEAKISGVSCLVSDTDSSTNSVNKSATRPKCQGPTKR